MNKKLRLQKKSSSAKTAKRATRSRTHSRETLGHQLLSQSNPPAAGLDVAGQGLPLNQLP